MTALTQLTASSQAALFIPTETVGESKGFPELDKTKTEVALAPMFTPNPHMPQMAMSVPTNVAQAIIKKESGEVIATCKGSHTLVQTDHLHRHMKKAFSAVLPQKWVDSMTLEEGVSANGAFNVCKYTSPDYSASIRQSSGKIIKLDMGMMTINHHGSRAVMVMPFMLDNSCQNNVIFTDEKASQQHTEGFDVGTLTSFAKHMVTKAPDHFKTIQAWALTPFSKDQFAAILRANSQISAQQSNAIVEYFEKVEAPVRGKNLYAALSALAAWGSHNTGDFYVRNSRNSDNEAESLFSRQEKIARLIASSAFQRVAS